MAKEKLGKVSVCPMGTYISTVTYQPLDIVTYNGESYMARTTNTGVTPVDGDNWQQLTIQKERKFELIETITLAEDTKSIIRTAEPDGTAYKFTDVKISIAANPTNTSVASVFGIYLYIANGALQVGGLYNDGFRSQFRMELFCLSNNGSSLCLGAKQSVEGAWNGTYVAPAFRTLNKNLFETPIDKILFETSSSVAMKAGGTISIYGIRKE